ncbi:monoacylglycerol lipase abhd6-B [Cucumis melo var. makuwa]|uniref:Monoacylglycerol lipase abhd6-B n=1 Tax=Cucumis melo var. makuwa TaxID=1194695 RepID=A0A5D3DP87_CUCMM|nr:monoacylglycerol lipase abhd6-B [Cucumis melo var. makuwa]TYK25447.1 monoacylglycerol lipase abhd6-B [Cucumis melo var. makuwa]
MGSSIQSGNLLLIKFLTSLLAPLNFIVFFFLDFFDAILCVIYRYLDQFLEGKVTACYCGSRGDERENPDGENELSETLYGRRNVFRRIALIGFSGRCEDSGKMNGGSMWNRWSDCGCSSCVDGMENGNQKLYVDVRQPAQGRREKPEENVIFLHGFLSSSSLWTETVFPNLSETTKQNYRLFAVDLLGFGRSPKPRDSFYTMKDHLEKIEESVIRQFGLNSFHLVAHSMGCLIALALAAKYSKSVKTITLVAPPYFPSKDGAAMTVLENLAAKRVWPPLLFGSSVMSWYEHVGRCACFFICRNHRIWEWILRRTNRRRNIDFRVIDLTKHTHHSAWHSMHNVICGGAKLMDGYLDELTKAGIKIEIYHGNGDVVAPIECSYNLKKKAVDATVNMVRNANHQTIILGREREFAQDLESTWSNTAHIERS